ncbi:E3 ubiquitin-protein ligase Mdm2 [Phycodurus eques]|uniref:E3 ubiquitin-protein ligase Mdm2 n=1 Tax=Phycodurus eques TaxID=693459 RepID=UPI002ACE5E3A|nr:E3 ubiquitin-protein ligase Mdm2 [Phycodurus eques]XP_061524087.1 E3 ubiquitin-protein ligase Mdm2 [Phycodurus eques]
MNTSDYNKVVRPKAELATLLQLAGATKDVLTLREVMFYLGQYIIRKQLYDKKQQHIVHCAQDALGRILGVETFSVKQPRILFAMLAKNLVRVRSQESAQSFGEGAGSSQTQQSAQEAAAGSGSSPPDVRRRRRRRTRSSRSNDAGPSCGLQGDDNDNGSVAAEDDGEGAKRSRSDSYSLTFDDSLSWCVIGGLGSGRDRHSSQSSESNSAGSDATAAADSDGDNFSVEFEVESVDSDDYSEDDAALSADDQEVYEVTIFDDDDSFDEDTEITEADYWRCDGCDELNPPLPRNCLRCWSLRQDWLRCASLPACADAAGSDGEDGVDVPDGKTVIASSAPDSQDALPASRPPSSCSSSSQEKSWTTCDSQPSSAANSQEQPADAVVVPELERTVSADARLPDSCLDPCLICQSRPKNGCIVHGKTGHLMSCYVCARKLKKHNKLCPVCRMPIQAVVLTYLS